MHSGTKIDLRKTGKGKGKRGGGGGGGGGGERKGGSIQNKPSPKSHCSAFDYFKSPKSSVIKVHE